MLPVATTTVTITRWTGQDGDPYEVGRSVATSVTVEAVIGSPSGSLRGAGGARSEVDAVLHVPAGTLLPADATVLDDQTGRTWRVAWVEERPGLGIDHVRAGLVRVSGAANG